jgi:hypothetical protein
MYRKQLPDYPNQMCEWKWQKMIARTCQPKARYWVWKGERKTAQFLMITFAYRFTYYLFYGLHIRRVDAFLKKVPSNLNNIYHAYIYINFDNKYLDKLDLRNFLVRKKTKSQNILTPQSVNPQIAKFAEVPNLHICGPPTFSNSKADFQFSIQLSSVKEDYGITVGRKKIFFLFM